jgi:hypothetical protein
VTLEIFGNAKTKSDLCDFTVLQIAEGSAMTGVREYRLGEKEENGWNYPMLVSTLIAGKDELDIQEGCGG